MNRVREPRALSMFEFVAMVAMLFATVAFPTDAMLPAFPSMAAELTPDAPNRIQLVIAAFMAGLGIGTFVTGPISDAYGRKPVVTGGVAIFIIGSLVAYFAQSLEVLLAGRVLQGLGAAGPRIGPLAMLRDLYAGRKMAQLTSIIMAVFMLFPAVAPFIGAQIIAVADWRAVFLVFILFAVTGALWLALRQVETLAPANRRPVRLASLSAAAREVVTNPMVMLFTFALTLGFTELLAVISSIQQIYDVSFGLAESFPAWFAGGAMIAASGTLLNAALVMRFGMRRLAIMAFAVQSVVTAAALLVTWADLVSGGAAFALWFLWSTSVFFMAGLIFGNLNALALQPLGHIAGTAASLVTGISTVSAALLAIPIGLAFDGTPAPLMAGNLACAALAFVILRRTVDQPVDAVG